MVKRYGKAIPMDRCAPRNRGADTSLSYLTTGSFLRVPLLGG